MKTAVIIGLGLIGGSLGLELKKRLNYKILGIDNNAAHLQKAIELGIIDDEATYEAIATAELVIVAVPVNHIAAVVCKALDYVGENTLVMDVGSVKNSICKAVAAHPHRKHFVAAHPMAGTEHSGPEAAIYDLFDGKVMALCEIDDSGWQFYDRAIDIAKTLNMRVKIMHAENHDLHTAYVSHLSHVSSFMLGKTVLEIEKDESQIFDLASTGFASTVRLAKSDAQMWCPIFLENKTNVLKALDEYIKNLQEFRTMIAEEQAEAIHKTIHDINYIRKILK